MTLSAHTPLIAFTLVLVVGAALKPAPLPRSISSDTGAQHAPSARSGAATGSAVARFATALGNLCRRESPVDATAAAVWCDELARAVRSGATLAAALRASPTTAGIDATVASICLSLDRGRSTAEAISSASTSSAHVALVLTVLRACAEQGGPAAEPLDRAASTLRARAADRADRLTQSAQARMSALVMTSLPVAMLGLMLVTSGSVRAAAASPLGVAAMTVGALLNVSGWAWMRRIIRHEAT